MIDARLEPPVGEKDRVRGPDGAPVTLAEYGDYDCPYTVRAFFAVRGLLRKMGDDVRFSFRIFPLAEIHEHAQLSAEAAEAAAAQGKFWEMHDRLFEARRDLAPEHILSYAGEIGLEVERFEKELEDHAHASAVREQLRSGLASGVRGTPTFFVNGRMHAGSFRMEDLETAIREALDEPSSRRD